MDMDRPAQVPARINRGEAGDSIGVRHLIAAQELPRLHIIPEEGD
jgi:hypothetical protein